MRVRKRFDAEKIRKKRKDFWDFIDFNKPLYKREPLISIRENVNGKTIPSEEEKLKSTNWRCGGLRGQSRRGGVFPLFLLIAEIIHIRKAFFPAKKSLY